MPSRRIGGLSWLLLGALSASCNLNPHGEDPSFDGASNAGIFPPADTNTGAPANTGPSSVPGAATTEEPSGMTGTPPVNDPTMGIPLPTGTTTATMAVPTDTAPPSPTGMPTATATTTPIDTMEPEPPLTDDAPTGSGGAANEATEDDGGIGTNSTDPDGGVNAASILATDGGTDLSAEQADTANNADGGAAGNGNL